MTLRRAAALLLIGVGSVCLAGGAYLPAKAALAQVLLRLAWVRTGAAPVRPWPWARTWPVGRLEVPRLGIDEIVLAGAEGAALAFAPGHVDGTASPGAAGNVVLAGHRDTAFRFLARLRPGEEIWLEGAAGRRWRYLVETTTVVDEHDLSALEATATPTLTLVTCYPLDAIRPGGPLRYVVRALGVESGGRPIEPRGDAAPHPTDGRTTARLRPEPGPAAVLAPRRHRTWRACPTTAEGCRA